MVLVYVGYLVFNVLIGKICVWLMGQGYCVVVIDVLNVFIGNLYLEQECVYVDGEEGLNCLLQDFYGYVQVFNGVLVVLLGSYVNLYIVGGIVEGGYFGFVELQYVYMLLFGEILVVFFFDGVVEEQCGSDWILCWW